MKLDDSLAALFLGEGKPDESAERVLEQAWAGPEVRAEIGEKAGEGFWAAARRDSIDALASLLNVPLIDIFVRGWKKYEEIARYGDPEKTPRGQLAEVALMEHTIRSAHKPSLDIYLNQVKRASVELEVSVALTLQSCVLAIRAPVIREIRLGRCKASGEIKLLRGAIVKSLPSVSLDFPGVYAPPGGIPLG